MSQFNLFNIIDILFNIIDILFNPSYIKHFDIVLFNYAQI